MKKLTTIVCAGLLTASAFAFETNQFKYIPKGAPVLMMDINVNGIPDIYWWDKNKDEVVQNNEIFFDLDEDGIIDTTYDEMIRLYRLQNRSEPKYKFMAPMVMK